MGTEAPKRQGRTAALAALVGAALVLAGCGTYFVPRHNKAAHLAAQAGWDYGMTAAGPFSLASALGPAARGAPILAVYLEGDGLAFLAGGTVSADPTPGDPQGLRLALAHPGGAAAYLARPCQYAMTPACSPQYWTSHRYAPAVLDAVDAALSQLKRQSGASRLILVGYSGGGALAALLAARRTDVAALVTIAADLDLGEWTRREGLTPLWGSDDPAAHAAALAALPQLHLVGGRDTVVPAYVARSFLARMTGGGGERLMELPDFRHDCCWAEDWPKIARLPPLAALPGWLPQAAAP
jgi:hypothetical protein